MENKVIEEIRKFVEDECSKLDAWKGKEPYQWHFIPVVNYCKLLAEKNNLSEDSREILEIAAWLHDIGSITIGSENHHITSGEIAERKLRELNYPKEKTAIVKKCIFSHRGSIKFDKESIEAVILADADAMSHFDDIQGLFQIAYAKELNRGQAREYVREKLIRSYNKLSEEGKEIAKSKYEAAMLLLS